MKQALIVAFTGAVRDRFNGRGNPLSIREKLRHAAAIAGVQGAEIIFPDECGDPAEVLDALAETGLALAAINVNLKARPEFQRGALSAADAAVRRSALDILLQGKDFAVRAGAERVTCAPLADGFDYALQQSYTSAWGRTLETLRTAVEEGPRLPLHLEHKPSEPRVHSLLDSPGTVLRLLDEIGSEDAGITFNVGHASLDAQSPAAWLAQVFESGVPLYLHLCDAAGGWDWDLLPGSYHEWQLLECLGLLVAHGYQGWLTSDSFPIRQEAQSFLGAHVQQTALALRSVQSDGAREWLASGGESSWKEVERWLFPNG